jgi:hypothetical protein
MQRRRTIGDSFGFIEPSESSLRRESAALNYPNGHYSPECVERLSEKGPMGSNPLL